MGFNRLDAAMTHFDPYVFLVGTLPEGSHCRNSGQCRKKAVLMLDRTTKKFGMGLMDGQLVQAGKSFQKMRGCRCSSLYLGDKSRCQVSGARKASR